MIWFYIHSPACLNQVAISAAITLSSQNKKKKQSVQIIKGVSLQYEALSHKGSPGSDAPNVDKNKTLYNI